MIDVKRHELEAAFRKNWKAYDEAAEKGSPHRLILFYAVECGLKVYIMRKNPRLKTTADFAEVEDLAQLRQTHDINLLLAKAGYRIATVKSIRYRAPGWPRLYSLAYAHQVHELWRYSVEANDENMQEVVHRLEEIAAWLQGEAD
ncbi:MAG: hypothetical protein ACM3X6_04340 [Patescibacteria group bacterium]